MNQADVKELFDYWDGDLYWKSTGSGRVDISMPSGSVDTSTGYRRILVKGKRYYAHRLIWLYVHGKFPDEQIDHINGDKLDNSIENLRDVTTQENQRNQSMRVNNKSGHMGVSWHTCKDKWQVHIKADSKTKHLGYFNILEDAIEARQKADIEYGFHENHGREAMV